jgi:histidyl-tRNA synthetase
MIGQYVVLKGQRNLLEKLKQDEALAANPSMQQGFSDMDLLFTYLEDFGALHTVSFDLSLARGMITLPEPTRLISLLSRSTFIDMHRSGLDYYTGVIYEVVTEGSAPAVPASEEAKEKQSKKKGGKSGDPDEDRSDDPTLGVGMCSGSVALVHDHALTNI